MIFKLTQSDVTVYAIPIPVELADLARLVGLYYPLWKPAPCTGKATAGLIKQGLKRLDNPECELGVFAQQVLNACELNPGSRVEVTK